MSKAVDTKPIVAELAPKPTVVGKNPFPADQEFVSIGFAKVPNSRDWCAYTIHTKNGKVTKLVFKQQPDFKASTIEWAKQAFQDAFLGE